MEAHAIVKLYMGEIRPLQSTRTALPQLLLFLGLVPAIKHLSTQLVLP